MCGLTGSSTHGRLVTTTTTTPHCPPQGTGQAASSGRTCTPAELTGSCWSAMWRMAGECILWQKLSRSLEWVPTAGISHFYPCVAHIRSSSFETYKGNMMTTMVNNRSETQHHSKQWRITSEEKSALCWVQAFTLMNSSISSHTIQFSTQENPWNMAVPCKPDLPSIPHYNVSVL